MRTVDRSFSNRPFSTIIPCLCMAVVCSLVNTGATAAADPVEIALGDPSLTAGVPGTGPITLSQIEKWLGDPANFVELKPILPLGLSQGAARSLAWKKTR